MDATLAFIKRCLRCMLSQGGDQFFRKKAPKTTSSEDLFRKVKVVKVVNDPPVEVGD